MTMCRIGATIKRHGPIEHQDQLGVVGNLIDAVIIFLFKFLKYFPVYYFVIVDRYITD